MAKVHSVRWVLLTLLSLASYEESFAKALPLFDGNKQSQLEELIQTRMTSQNIPGVSVAVIHDGQVRYQAGFGVADRAGRVIYHGGSNPGYESETGFVPGQGFGYVVLANASTGLAFGNVAGLMEAVKALLLARPVPPLGTGLASRVYAGVIAIAMLILLVGALRSAFCFWRPAPNPLAGAYDSISGVIRLLLPSLVLVLLAYLFAYSLPKQFSIPLGGLRAFSPDAGWGMTIAAGAACTWAVVRLLVSWRNHKTV